MRYSFLIVLLLGLSAAACSAQPAAAPLATQPPATLAPVSATASLIAPSVVPSPTVMPGKTPIVAAPTETLAVPTDSPIPSGIPGVDPFDVSVGLYFLDTTGFGEMATVLGHTQEMELSFRTRVARVKKVLAQVPFPLGLEPQGKEFNESLESFFIAMRDNDLPGTIAQASEVAGAQQALSAELDVWLEAGPAHTETVDPFNVILTHRIIGETDYGQMAARLSETQKVDPALQSTLQHGRRVLQFAAFASEIRAQADELAGALDNATRALDASDVNAAVTALKGVEEAQDNLSRAIETWLETNPEQPTEPSPFQISIAQFYLDSAGFHEMAEQLGENETIEPEYLATVARVGTLLHHITWASEVARPAETFLQALDEFELALQENNVQDAITVSETVHDAQHELSQAIDEWLGGEAIDH